MGLQFSGMGAVRFGAVHLAHQNGATEGMGLKAAVSPQPQWQAHDVVSFDTKKPLAHVSQSKNAKTHVQFFNGKGGFSAIVYADNLRMIALPGSHIELPDTVLDLPGKRIEGSEVINDAEGAPQPVQTITKQAMIMGAGLATRFEPIAGDVTGVAKPSAPLAGKDSVIVSIARQLYQHGIRHIIINTYYKPDLLKKQMNAFNKELVQRGLEPVRLTYADEKAPSGDAGGLLVALQNHKNVLNPKEPLLTVYGDSVTADVDFSALINAARQHGAKITIGAKRVEDKDLKNYGIAVTDRSGPDGESGRIEEFVEKPALPEKDGPSVAEKMKRVGNSRLASTGIYVFSPEVFKDYEEQATAFQKEGKLFGFAHHMFPAVMKKYKDDNPMWAERIRGYWTDIGNPAQYVATIRDAMNGKLGPELAAKVKKQVDAKGVIYWPGTRKKVEQLRSIAQYEGSPFKLEGNIVVANAPRR
jgi:NDP-sugar pyrophosphorylase family protein